MKNERREGKIKEEGPYAFLNANATENWINMRYAIEGKLFTVPEIFMHTKKHKKQL